MTTTILRTGIVAVAAFAGSLASLPQPAAAQTAPAPAAAPHHHYRHGGAAHAADNALTVDLNKQELSRVMGASDMPTETPVTQTSVNNAHQIVPSFQR